MLLDVTPLTRRLHESTNPILKRLSEQGIDCPLMEMPAVLGPDSQVYLAGYTYFKSEGELLEYVRALPPSKLLAYDAGVSEDGRVYFRYALMQ